MLEERTEDLDMYADLTEEGESVEGMTVFVRDKPMVRISRQLTEDPSRANRLRTTLTHEFGHVYFHSCLFGVAQQAELFRDEPVHGHAAQLPVCHRATIIEAGPVDWMEWQAGYVCGAILMPASEVLVQMQALTEMRSTGTPGVVSPAGRALIASVARRFGTSIDAARVRLSRLGYISPQTPSTQAALFT